MHDPTGTRPSGRPPRARGAQVAPSRALLLASLLLALVARDAGAQGASQCLSLQLAAAGEAARRKVVCAARAAALGTDVDERCLALADARLARSWARALARGDCPTPADAAAAQAIVDGFVATLAQALTPPLPSHCCDTGPRCFGAPAIDASSCQLELFGTLGPPGTVCDGASGNCVAPPGTGGPCCALPGSFCSASPADGPEICSEVGGSYLDNAVCTATGTCTIP